jgi:transposase
MKTRLKLSDEYWSKLKVILLSNGIYSKKNLRLNVEAIFFRLRTGVPWRDLPAYFGKWNSIYKRFNHWNKYGKIINIFDQISKNNPDLEWVFIDGSYVKAHQHSMGARQEEETAIGKSVGGNTTKIHAGVDSFGNPIKIITTGGEVHDSKIANEIIRAVPKADCIVADRGYDSEEIREQIRNQNSTPVIPRKKNSLIGNSSMDWGLYKYRHLVENFFARIKHFRAIATRYDKLKRNYEGALAFVCIYLWLPL